MIVFKPQDYGLSLLNFVPTNRNHAWYTCTTDVDNSFWTFHVSNFTQQTMVVSGPFVLFALRSDTSIISSASNISVDGVLQPFC